MLSERSVITIPGHPLFTREGVLKTDRAGMLKLRDGMEAIVAKEVEISNVAQMLKVMGVSATIDDPAEVQKTIMEGILAAESFDDIFSENIGELESGRNLLGIPLMVTGVRWNSSDFNEDGGLPFYGVVEAVNEETGEKINFSCGSTTAMAQLFRADQLGQWPLHITLKETGRTTKAGYRPYWFKRTVEK